MLSAWNPETAASDSSPAGTSCSLESGEPKRPLTAAAAAAAEAAEEPRPEPKGRPFLSFRATPADCGDPNSLSVAAAAIPAQFSSAFRESLPPSPSIASMIIFPGSPGKGRAITVSPAPPTAAPSQSNPGPRLATVAGANAVTEEAIG